MEANFIGGPMMRYTFIV